MRVRVIHLKAHTFLDPSQNSCRFSDKKTHVKNKLKSPDTSHETHTHIFTSFYTELLFSHSSRPNPKTWAYLQHIFQSLTKNQHQKNTVSATNLFFGCSNGHRTPGPLFFEWKNSHQEAAGISSLGLCTAKACKAQVISPPRTTVRFLKVILLPKWFGSLLVQQKSGAAPPKIFKIT